MADHKTGRRIRNYRVMFAMSLGGLALGGVATVGGIASLFFAPAPTLITTGVLLVCLSALNGYKLVLSTMRLMDREGYDASRYQQQ